MKLKLLPLLLLFTNISSKAQTLGCTDLNASNFSPLATVNDGSCIYANTSYTPALLNELGSAMDESSALIRIDGAFWTLNDSGNPAELYQMDTLTGQVLRTVYIENMPNMDWEAMAQNDTHVFIGDFGNNSGARQNLRILKILKSELQSHDTVTAETIRFHYPEQTDFTPGNNQTAYDCEAFLFANDSLHLFTKDWISQQSAHYVIPTDTGFHAAYLSETFNVNGLITDASTYQGNTVLLGYKNMGFGVYTCFIWFLNEYNNTHFFSGNKRRIEIGNALQLGQTEGIHLSSGTYGHLTSESIINGTLGINEPAKMHRFNFSAFLPATSDMFDIPNTTFGFNLFPNPAQNVLRVNSPFQSVLNYELMDSYGRIRQRGNLTQGLNDLNITELISGIYFIRFIGDNKQTISFIKN